MIYGLDTETDNDGQSAWIVQWCIHDGRKAIIGGSLDSLTSRLAKLGRPGKHYLYCHNLKYDLAFIVYAIYAVMLEYEGDLHPIIRKNSPVSITLKANGRTLIFRDSAKKWQGNLASLGKAYGVPKLEAPEEDFAPGWSERVDFSDPRQWDYVKRDAEIVAVSMQAMHRKQHAKKATTSGDAWADMHRTINKGWTRPGHDRWSYYFPPLGYELDRMLRPAYFGGINISQHQGHYLIGPITHEDIVSMYPSRMKYKRMPYGSPIYIGSALPPDDELYIMKLRLKMHLKKNRIAWFAFKQGYDAVIEDIPFGTAVSDTKAWHELTLSSVDLETLAEDYDLEIDPLYETETWVFKSMTGIFDEYIDKWLKVKSEAPKGSPEREHAKRMLNAAYGRFALIQEAEDVSLIEEDEDLKWVSALTVSENDGYLPVAIFTCAYARQELMQRVRMICDARGSDAVVHSDTDSVIYLGEPLGEHGKDLGQWDIESRPVAMYEGGFKRYVEIFDGPPWDAAKQKITGLSITAAGVPQRTAFDGCPVGMWIEILDDPSIIATGTVLGRKDYKIKSKWLRDVYLAHGRDPDRVNTFKLIPVKVPGGVILDERTHELSDNLKIRFNRAL